ncbi:MAG TPA: hypothetical protein VE714_11255, partial [Gemmatimonadales bacterium]|nr:hypothetical protein [Gemmatimonadales bacterium]
RDTCRFTALPKLIQKAVRDELKAFFDQLIVDFALLLDLFGSLELRGQAGLELAETDIVKSSGVDVISRDPAAVRLTHFDRTVDRPI